MPSVVVVLSRVLVSRARVRASMRALTLPYLDICIPSTVIERPSDPARHIPLRPALSFLASRHHPDSHISSNSRPCRTLTRVYLISYTRRHRTITTRTEYSTVSLPHSSDRPLFRPTRTPNFCVSHELRLSASTPSLCTSASRSTSISATSSIVSFSSALSQHSSSLDASASLRTLARPFRQQSTYSLSTLSLTSLCTSLARPRECMPDVHTDPSKSST